MMTKGEEKRLEELLREWYRWQSSYRPDLGSGRVSASCRAFSEAGRHTSDEDRREEEDRRAWHDRSQQVEACVSSLNWQLRASIQTQMLNTEARAAVWRNARITPEANAVLYIEAKAKLFPMFVVRGLQQREEIFEGVL